MKYLVFDVESVGLHGQAFAVGGVILDTVSGTISGDFLHACPPENARGSNEDLAWVTANIPRFEYRMRTPMEILKVFSMEWETRRKRARLAADCPWPVEARFLNACVDYGYMPEKHGPYPLVDINSLYVAKLDSPLLNFPRLPSELPIHNPLADARQSARLLWEYLEQKAKA